MAVAPGKRPTIHDVAARAGVSKSLVSLALRGSDRVAPESRDAILAAAAELGYRTNAAARSLAAQQSGTIGVLILDLHNPVFIEILDGVRAVVQEHDYNMMLVSGNADPALEIAELTKLLEFQVEGLILIAHRLDEATVHRLARECPTVVITRRDITGPDLNTVSGNDVLGGRMATEHLISLGHTRIAHITGGRARIAQDRTAGYTEAMFAAGLEPIILEGDFTERGGQRAAQALLTEEPRPSAVFVANDVSAIGALGAFATARVRVPEDIAIVGYDGLPLGALPLVDLTTVTQPLIEMGRVAAEQVFAQIADPSASGADHDATLALTVRGSTSLLT